MEWGGGAMEELKIINKDRKLEAPQTIMNIKQHRNFGETNCGSFFRV